MKYAKQNTATIQSDEEKYGKVGCGLNRGDRKVLCDDALNSSTFVLTWRL